MTSVGAWIDARMPVVSIADGVWNRASTAAGGSPNRSPRANELRRRIAGELRAHGRERGPVSPRGLEGAPPTLERLGMPAAG